MDGGSSRDEAAWNAVTSSFAPGIHLTSYNDVTPESCVRNGPLPVIVSTVINTNYHCTTHFTTRDSQVFNTKHYCELRCRKVRPVAVDYTFIIACKPSIQRG